MSLPLYDNGMLSGLLAGVLFGYALEGGGLSSPKKLTGQFSLRDWTVFKVMFTAVIVAAAGLWLSEQAGLIAANGVFVPTVYLWATAGGGALIGAGFAIGGYCPGTSAAGLASGRGDALVFIVGMLAGTWLFSAFFSDIEPLYNAAKGPAGQTVSGLSGLPSSVVIAAMIVIAAAGWALAVRVEKAKGGPITVDEVLESSDATPAGGAKANHPRLTAA